MLTLLDQIRDPYWPGANSSVLRIHVINLAPTTINHQSRVTSRESVSSRGRLKQAVIGRLERLVSARHSAAVASGLVVGGFQGASFVV